MTHKLDRELKGKSLYERSPFLEQSMLMPLIPDPRPFEAKSSVEQAYFHSVEYVESLPSPRVIKTHLPLTLLPENLLEKAKVVFVARDPRDACVSYFHHMKVEQFSEECQFNDFAKLFKSGKMVYGDYFKCLKVRQA